MGFVSEKEIVRLEKEFTIVKTTKELQTYKIDNKKHRKDGPASIFYYGNGDKMWEYWFINGNLYREGGHAII